MLNVFLELKLAFIVNATRQSRRCIQLELAQTRTGLQTKLEGATRLPVHGGPGSGFFSEGHHSVFLF